MAYRYRFLKDWLFCCCEDEQDQYNIYNENDDTARLIPDDLEPIYYSGQNSGLVDQQQKLQERLGTIVRSKECQMVNVNSRIPFNLHNQILPPETWLNPNPGLKSLSRSISPSGLVHNLTLINSNTYYDSSRDTIPYRHPLHPSNPYPCVPSSPQSTEPSLPESPERETPTATTGRPNPILNVRLVGFVDQRGRTREHERRFDLDLDVDGDIVGSDSTVMQVTINRNSNHHLNTPPLGNFKLEESGAISRSWSD